MLQSKILEMDHAYGRIERALIDRQARHAAVAEHMHQIILGDVRGHRDDLGLGDGNVLDRHVTQVAYTRRAIGTLGGVLLVFVGVLTRVEYPDHATEKPARFLTLAMAIRLRALRCARRPVRTLAHPSLFQITGV